MSGPHLVRGWRKSAVSSRTVGSSREAVWSGRASSSCHPPRPRRTAQATRVPFAPQGSPAGTGAQLLKIPRSLPAWVSTYPELRELFLSLPSNLILAIYSNVCVFGERQGGLYYGLEYFGEALVSRRDAGTQLGKTSANRIKITQGDRPADPRR